MFGNNSNFVRYFGRGKFPSLRSKRSCANEELFPRREKLFVRTEERLLRRLEVSWLKSFGFAVLRFCGFAVLRFCGFPVFRFCGFADPPAPFISPFDKYCYLWKCPVFPVCYFGNMHEIGTITE